MISSAGGASAYTGAPARDEESGVYGDVERALPLIYAHEAIAPIDVNNRANNVRVNRSSQVGACDHILPAGHKFPVRGTDVIGLGQIANAEELRI